MCNDYGNRIPYSAYVEAFSNLKIPIIAPGGAPNLEPRDDIWPTDTAPIIRRVDNGAEPVQLRWGFPPSGPKGPPVINMRSEKRRFAHGRCLVPASHFYEFTGEQSPKSKWRFTKAGEEWFCIAGFGALWKDPRPPLLCSPASRGLTWRRYITGKSWFLNALNGYHGSTSRIPKPLCYVPRPPVCLKSRRSGRCAPSVLIRILAGPAKYSPCLAFPAFCGDNPGLVRANTDRQKARRFMPR